MTSFEIIVLTFILTVVCAFVLGVLTTVWVAWRLIESLVRQDCEQRGYQMALADRNQEAIHNVTPLRLIRMSAKKEPTHGVSQQAR